MATGESRLETSLLVQALDRAGLLVEVVGELPDSVAGVADDSRRVAPGVVFIAVRGSAVDGHEFLSMAASAGASLAVVEDRQSTALPRIIVRDTRRAVAVMAAEFHGHPASALDLVAVTGTNGKTTTVHILRHLLGRVDGRGASIGTLGVLLGSAGELLPGGAGLTTPGPVELQRVLRELVDHDVRAVAMEVSSHSLEQHRVDGLHFDAAVFTNFTRDHLDYHHTMEAYFEAKARLIDHLSPSGVAVVNADEPAWRKLRPASRVLHFSGNGDASAEVAAEGPSFSVRGTECTFRFGTRAIAARLPLIGAFNVENALGAAAVGWALGMTPESVVERLATVPQVPGRLEVIADSPLVLRDYAHTPDALQRALRAVRPFASGRVIVVFGCGGDRDRGKRPQMGRIAIDEADVVILTSDNPRTEDPERILDDIAVGVGEADYRRVEDRRLAIAEALAIADPERDLILLAGKGHETYQIRGTQRFPFDEAVIVRQLLGER